jgi:hypothetical protein
LLKKTASSASELAAHGFMMPAYTDTALRRAARPLDVKRAQTAKKRSDKPLFSSKEVFLPDINNWHCEICGFTINTKSGGKLFNAVVRIVILHGGIE